MKVVMKQVNLYRFEELSKEAQEKFQQSFANDFNQDFSDCYEPEFISRLQDIGINTDKISYSGFCSQGDGLSFLGTITEDCILPFIEKYHFKKLSEYVQKEHEKLSLEIKAKNIRNFYVHENSVYCDVPGDLPISDDLYTELSELSGIVNEERMRICRNLYQELSLDYDRTMSYENAQENAELNDYWFTEDGEIAE